MVVVDHANIRSVSTMIYDNCAFREDGGASANDNVCAGFFLSVVSFAGMSLQKSQLAKRDQHHSLLLRGV